MGKFVTELIGTFFPVLAIGMTAIAPGAGGGAAALTFLAIDPEDK